MLLYKDGFLFLEISLSGSIRRWTILNGQCPEVFHRAMVSHPVKAAVMAMATASGQSNYPMQHEMGRMQGGSQNQVASRPYSGPSGSNLQQHDLNVPLSTNEQPSRSSSQKIKSSPGSSKGVYRKKSTGGVVASLLSCLSPLFWPNRWYFARTGSIIIFAQRASR
jgi:hypothetical protein